MDRRSFMAFIAAALVYPGSSSSNAVTYKGFELTWVPNLEQPFEMDWVIFDTKRVLGVVFDTGEKAYVEGE